MATRASSSAASAGRSDLDRTLSDPSVRARMAAFCEAMRLISKQAREQEEARIARRLAEKQAESEASYERTRQLMSNYRPAPLSPKQRDLIKSGRAPLRKHPAAKDRGLDLPIDGPWHDSIGGYYGVEELDFG